MRDLTQHLTTRADDNHVVALVIVELQQLGHHLRVGVGGKFHAQLQQMFLDLHIVFNDAVVDQSNITAFADVGVGVHITGLAVGCPAGVADAQRPLQVHAAMTRVASVVTLKPPAVDPGAPPVSISKMVIKTDGSVIWE